MFNSEIFLNLSYNDYFCLVGNANVYYSKKSHGIKNILHMNGSQHYKSHSDSEQSITEEISGDDPMSERDSDPISPEYVEHVVSGVVERWLDLHGEKLFQLSSSKYLAKQQTKKARDSKKAFARS